MGPDTTRVLALLRRLADAEAHWRMRSAQLLRVTDIELSVLLDVARNGGMAPGVLSRGHEFSTGGAQALIARLERAGLLRREPDIEYPQTGFVALSPAAALELEAVMAPLTDQLESLRADEDLQAALRCVEALATTLGPRRSP